MAITDAGVPSNSVWYAIKQFILTNLTSPSPGTWNVSVNNDWLEYKKAKTFQVCIVPIYSETQASTLTGGASLTAGKISTAYYQITLTHPDRESAHGLFRNTVSILNNETLSSPQAGGALTGVAGTDYHWIRIQKAAAGEMITLTAPECGPDGKHDKCNGFRYDITVAVRWNE